MNEMEAIARQACAVLDAKQAENTLCLDISQQSIIADYFVICSGRNTVLTRALYDELEEKMAAAGKPLLRAEGYREGRWVVMDFGGLIVHIFHEPEREFYHLERLWDSGTNRLELELS
ncbi:MAG: ribosome silencing factor [Christensenellaceae bacterium]|jgi:ribosome-associated protein|nr:ribosome silencing factor [Christensenellaceae bacterium]